MSTSSHSSRQTQTKPTEVKQHNYVDFRHRTLGCLILFLDFLSVCTGTLVGSPIIRQIEMRFLIKLAKLQSILGFRCSSAFLKMKNALQNIGNTVKMKNRGDVIKLEDTSDFI